MSTTIQSTPAVTARPDGSDPRRWKALAVLGLIHFMLVLTLCARVSAQARPLGESSSCSPEQPAADLAVAQRA